MATPPPYAQKGLLYCLDAIRGDLLAWMLRAELEHGIIGRRELIQVERDTLGRIIDWDYFERKVSERRLYADDAEELAEIDEMELNPKRTTHIPAEDALLELSLRNPYLTDEEAVALYPDD